MLKNVILTILGIAILLFMGFMNSWELGLL